MRPYVSTPEDPPPPPAEPASESETAGALSALFREHNRALVGFIRRRVDDPQEAREIAQEAYVRLLQLDRPVAVGYLRWYLFKIARHLTTDRFRQRAARARIDRLDDGADLELGNPTEAGALAAEELGRLRAALAELPPKIREALVLHRVEGLSSTAIAARLGLTDRMIRYHLQRGLVYCRLRCDGVPAAEAWQRSQS
jgi:RNA polymerase sigma-70 factor (ECF subfamily)